MSGPRLSITPAGAIFDRSLEPRDLQVLNLLGCYTDKSGWCRRSQVKMAVQLNCGRASVQRSLERLVDAGWVEKKRPPWSNETGQPSNSYMYRVILDRDDATIDIADDDDAEAPSHAETASHDDECPPVGTPSVPEGAQPDGHPGAQPYVGTGAHTYVGTKNDPLERPPLEREREARARDRTARFLADFEARWPTAAVDDRQRTAYAAAALTEAEQQAALAGIGPFLEHLKRVHRGRCPAGWKYLEEKRWTLLAAKDHAAQGSHQPYPLDSPPAKALAVVFALARKSDLFSTAHRKREGVYYSTKAITPRLEALAGAPPRDSWASLSRQQAAAWDDLVGEFVGANRQRLKEGDLAPWPWPPRKDGSLSDTGPPDCLMTDQDAEALSRESF